jgi:hypothetical protein
VDEGLRTLADRDRQRMRDTLAFLYANTDPPTKTRH